ncbi:hypothetical protein CCACVL1_14261 [Corchorus capsularis]|uniref:VLRF1 domain-containing protein n=1 Tax=Corchorus capsularis TaxID=210143 RepID=A0A1R3I7S4_COCAP|nr:hypothetical protein CCACVL1_14261 [Corchorus capsularis]
MADSVASIFDLRADFFDSCRLLSPSSTTAFESLSISENDSLENQNDGDGREENSSSNGVAVPRCTCNTCKAEFDSLQEQRSHFKSDIHRLNVKLKIAGKDIVKEEDFDEELNADFVKDYDVSSISGSEDEADKVANPRNNAHKRQKLFIRLKSGERVSIWKSLIMNESESVSYENKEVWNDNGGNLTEVEVIERLKTSVQEEYKGAWYDNDNRRLRIVLLSAGGHFAGCVFDGNSVVDHKTFHRYVVRAKAGKKQSSKDGKGKAAHSAGAALRRHNELALKKEVQELLAAWKHYFDASSCVFIHAPSSNRHMLFNGDKPHFSHKFCSVRNVPLTVRRPTLKEAKRVYSLLTEVVFEVEESDIPIDTEEDLLLSSSTIGTGNQDPPEEEAGHNLNCRDASENPSINGKSAVIPSESESDGEVVCTSTPLHEAAQSGDAQRVLELLEQGLDPSVKDERGRTPYMLAKEKEVRNTFRRFMASNPNNWDWNAAKVPSALTKEMEESQAAKQAEKDAKRKARAKELKKLRRAKEKKAQAEAAQSQNTAAISHNQATVPSVTKGQSQPVGGSKIFKEEELKRAQAAEREKRAAAAERRIAEAAAASTGVAGDINCSCCNTSLAGKVPFHRYNYKYCSTSCMHVHREILEEG